MKGPFCATKGAREQGGHHVAGRFDFFFMGQAGEPGNVLTAVAVKERRSGMVMASVVPSKAANIFISKRVIQANTDVLNNNPLGSYEFI